MGYGLWAMGYWAGRANSFHLEVFRTFMFQRAPTIALGNIGWALGKYDFDASLAGGKADAWASLLLPEMFTCVSCNSFFSVMCLYVSISIRF